MSERREDRIVHNDALFREANEKIRASAEMHSAQWDVPFLCECATPDCVELIRMSPAEYARVRENERRFMVVPGHEVVEGANATVVKRAAKYVLVEK
jgi:hypothetical protein